MRNTMNIPRILEKLKATDNVKLQVNMLTGLTAVLPFKALRNDIIMSDIIYMAAHNVLSQGMGDNSERVLGFLTALLRAGAGLKGPSSEARAPAARNMLRRSGCLQDMANMFLGTMMMYEENWKTLCECLIESCKDCEENQSYCSTLIPTCIQRCDVRNTEVLKMLHTLLLNHTRNVDLFVECNGLSIFTRETIRDSSKMELLSVVVQNSLAAGLLKRNKDLMKCLFTIGENGQESLKMVEWASVILFYIVSHNEGNDKTEVPGEKQSQKINTKNALENTEPSLNDFSVSFLFKPNWDMAKTTNMSKNTNTGNEIFQRPLQNSISAIQRSNCIGGTEDRSSLRSSVFDNSAENNFMPNFVSTPKRQLLNERKVTEFNKVQTNIAALKGASAFRQDPRWNNSSATVKKQKLSMSARLFNIVNNSCVSMYQMFGNMLFRNAAHTNPQIDLLKSNSNFNEEKLSCGFTDYLKPQVFHNVLKKVDTASCQVKRKLGIKQKYRKNIMRKLKTGIHFYGCNFKVLRIAKKISRSMWPQERQMTPQVLYSIYRKCIVK